MAHVIVLDSVTQDIFVCGACKNVFNSLQMFLDHKSFQCNSVQLNITLPPTTEILQTAVLNNTVPHESLTFRNSDALCEAANDGISTQLQDYTCEVCKKHFKNSKSLLTHAKTHNEKFQCLLCGRCFNQSSHLQRHISSHRVWPDGLTKTTARTLEAELLSYSCVYCNLIMSSYNQYRTHLKVHSSMKKFKCLQYDCRVFCDTIEDLLQHISLIHKTPKYTCHLCRSIFNNLEDIALHQNTHDKIGKSILKNLPLHKCTQCDAEFRNPDKLALHMLTESHKKACIHCGKIFASDKRLRLHLQIHTQYKPFLCHICNISFPMKKYLSAHVLKHGSRQFKCSVCKYMFKRSDLLQRHMRLHQAKKLFKCPFKESLDCNKEFTRSDKLKLHIKSHTKYISTNKVSKPKL